MRRYPAAVTVLISPRRTYATILDNDKTHLHRRWNDDITDVTQNATENPNCAPSPRACVETSPPSPPA